jgi:type VI secretion system protein ImpL
MISSFFRALFAWLMSRAFWTIVGLIVAALLIWFMGPLFAFGDMRPLESEGARAWTIVALVAYFILRHFWRRWRSSATNAAVADRLRDALTLKRTDESPEIAILRGRFDEAMRILKRARFAQRGTSWLSRLFGRGRYLYELPWYMIIGAPGVGKTTALLNSGLSFPLAKSMGKGSVKGVGGTRHCDWWFTNEAVLIDTAGRYTTHESNAESDKVEWQGFLKLLRHTRSSQPINGVLLALAVDELLDASPEARRAHAETLRQRLDELRNGLGIAFPVYVVINKCDLMSGFDEYFATLDRSGREQVWGCTLPLVEGQASLFDSKVVEAELELLKTRIQDGLIDALQAEAELGRRALIYSFPQQFALLAAAVRDVAETVFADSRYSASPMLRGVYFTSGTQEGAPLDRVLSALGNLTTEGREKQAARGTAKSYFLNDLLSKVVFTEAHLAGLNLRVDGRARTLHFLAYGVSVCALLGSAAVWITSYRNNLTYLSEVDGKVDLLSERLAELPGAVDGNLYALLGALNQAETAPDSLHFRAVEPLTPWTFGLYQGHKLIAGARPLYHELLRTRLAPALKARLEFLLRTVAVEDLEFAYEILKTYLMLHDPERFDAASVQAFFLADWDYNMPPGAGREERAAIERHVAALIAIDAALVQEQPDSTLVEATRTRLSQHSFAHRTYRRLARSLEVNQLPDFSIGAIVGPQAPTVFRRTSGRPLTDGVPSLYTFRGYHELFAKEVGNVVRYVGKDEAWVLGVDEAAAKDRALAIASGKLVLEVKRLYMWDYVAHWERFLDDINIIQPRSLGEAAELARLLSSPDSPMARLMQAAVKETTLLKDTKTEMRTDASLLDRVRRSAQATQDDVSRIVGPSMMPGRLGPEERPELIVDTRFDALRRAVGNGEAGSPMTATLQSLAELHLLLSSTEAARAGGYPPPTSDLPARLQAEAGRLSQPGRRLLETVAGAGATLIARETRVSKGSQMVGTVTRACRETIEGRYPFARGATNEVAADDFTRMFGPGGVLDDYFKTELTNFVDTSTSPWRLRPGAQGGMGAGDSVAVFEQAQTIKDAFFRSGAGAPRVTVTIKPIVMDASITGLTLDVDGQQVRYQHGPQVGYTVNWPGKGGSNRVKLALEPTFANQNSALVLEGQWALHRLFDQATILPGDSPERFRAVINVGGRKATFEVTAGSVKNPFRMQELGSFRCPAGL